jgi:hypothetical protein
MDSNYIVLGAHMCQCVMVIFYSSNNVCRHGGCNITMTKLLPVIMYRSSLSITYMLYYCMH